MASNRELNFRRLLPRDWRYYVRGGGSLAVTHVAGLFLGLITTYLFTNFTPESTCAHFGYALSVLAIASIAALPGVDTAIAHAAATGHDAALRIGTRQRFRSSFFGLAGVLLWAAALVALGRRDQALVIAVVAFLAPLLFPFSSVFSFLQGKGRFVEYTWLNLLVEMAKTAALAIAVLLAGARGIGAILAVLGTTALGYLAINQHYSRRLVASRELGDEFGVISRRLSGAAALGIGAAQVDKLIVGTLFGPATMAAYTLAFVLTDPLRGFGTLAAKLLFPQIVRSDALAPLFVRKYMFGLLLLGCALLAITTAYWLGFPLVQPVLFPAYEGAIPIIRWLIVGTTLSIFDIVAGQVLWGMKDLRFLYFTQFIFPIQRVVLLAGGAFLAGVTGILFAQVVHYLLAAVTIHAFWLWAYRSRRRPAY
jgi:O-antigen/teichoic acid export membrane protein